MRDILTFSRLPRTLGALTASLVMVWACGAGSSDSAAPQGASASADAGTSGADGSAPPVGGTVVRLIHYNDLHAHLVAHPTLVGAPDGQIPATAKVAMRGGIAQLATKIKALRADNPNALLMNIGDTYHGGVEALYTQGEAIAAPVNALGVDVGVPGNWDYAFGPGITRLRYTGNAMAGILQCVQEGLAQGGGSGSGGGPRGSDAGAPLPKLTRPSFPNLAANVTFASGPIVKPGDPFLPATFVKDVGGVKVGFIGISSDIVPRMHPMLACGLTFLGADDLANGDAAAWSSKYTSLIETNAKALRASGANVVVVMSELGIQKNYYLANTIQAGSVDVVFSAHTHEAVFRALTSTSGALVVEAGDDTYVGHMDVRVLDGKVVDREWTLDPVTSDTPEDPAMKKLVDAARAPFLVQDPNMLIPGNTGAQLALNQSITSVIGKTPYPLTRKNALDSSFNDFFTDALRTRAATQIGMAPGFRFDVPIATSNAEVEGAIVADGTVTLEDAYRFFPVVYKMGTADVTGAQFHDVLEGALDDVFSTNAPLQSGGWVEGFAGMHVTVNLAAPKGQRVLAMTQPDSSPMSATATFSIAGCRRPYDAPGILCSRSGFTNVQDLLDGNGQPVTDVGVLIDALAHPSANAPAPALTDTSGTTLWPASPYVQPLVGATGH